jgi:hypothetical protein
MLGIGLKGAFGAIPLCIVVHVVCGKVGISNLDALSLVLGHNSKHPADAMDF